MKPTKLQWEDVIQFEEVKVMENPSGEMITSII